MLNIMLWCSFKFYLEQKRGCLKTLAATMKLSLRTLNGSSCSGFPQEEETSVKDRAFSDSAILRDCFHT